MDIDKFIEEEANEAYGKVFPGRAINIAVIKAFIDALFGFIQNCPGGAHAAKTHMKRGGFVAGNIARRAARAAGLSLWESFDYGDEIVARGKKLSDEQRQEIVNAAHEIPRPPADMGSSGPFPTALSMLFVMLFASAAVAGPFPESLPVTSVFPTSIATVTPTIPKEVTPKAIVQEAPVRVEFPHRNQWSYNGGNHSREQLIQHIINEQPDHQGAYRREILEGLSMQSLIAAHSALHDRTVNPQLLQGQRRTRTQVTTTSHAAPTMTVSAPQVQARSQATYRRAGMFGLRRVPVYTQQVVGYNYSSGCPGGVCPN